MTLHSAAELAHHVSGLGTAVQRGQAATMQKAASVAKISIGAAMDPSGLSHWGRGRSRGAKVKVSAKVEDEHTVKVTPSPKSLAGLLERGSYKAGTTWKVPKRSGHGRRTRRTVATYSHARVPPRNTWSNAVKAGTPPVVAELHKQTQNQIKAAFGG